MVTKLSSVSTMSAASRATAVPERPIATPIEAARRAGASLTPSPVTATTSSSACRIRTMRSLSCGETRAATPLLRSRAASTWSSMSSISAPVTGSMPVPSPRRDAMDAAVAGWSPVIMTTVIPARRQSATASATPARGGSSIASRPRKVSPVGGGSGRWTGSAGSSTRIAVARTRMP
jgi:hypothetical protein